MKNKNPDFTSLKDYFLIGDLHSAALVSVRGSVDWLCWPHFNSPSVFAKILDAKGGCFAPEMQDWKSKASYRKDTAIVDFEWNKGGQSFRMADFMVPQTMPEDVLHLMVRKCWGATHPVWLRFRFEPRPDYAKNKTRLKRSKNKLIMNLEKEALILYLPKSSRIELRPQEATVQCLLRPGETLSLVMEYSRREIPSYGGEDYEESVNLFWQNWVAKGKFNKKRRDRLVRSAITLKLMQFYPTGALIAAPTTSLPEAIGGERNWDYRYIWVRDATLILYGLQMLGYTEEAVRFFQYMERVTKTCENKDIHIKLMYTIEGSRVPKEAFLKEFSGYKNSGPVRIGNQASDQFQLDAYGAMIDAYHFMTKNGILPSALSKALILHLAERIEQLWQTRDNGIWEIRKKQHHFTYSKIMAWVGIDRLLHMHRELGLTQDQINHYRKLERQIHQWIWQHCYDREKGLFRQHPHTSVQDATNFLFVLLKFLNKRDPKTRVILEKAVRKLVRGPYVYRYKNNDGLKGKEGAFLLCSFWYISALALVGEIEEAEKKLDELEKKISPTGLLAEEIDPKTGEYLGNFPQALSHIGYIMSVHHIEKGKRKRKNS